MKDSRTAPALAAALLVAALGLPATAQGVFLSPPPSGAVTGPLTGQRAQIAQELPYLGYRNVDVRRLSTGQVAHIAMLLHSNRSQGDIHGQVGSVLRGGGILQDTFDRLRRR